jgi:nucleotide-binding universal stress UspA family protein
MPSPVLVGVDERAGGREAIALARALVPGAPLTLATAFPYAQAPSRFASTATEAALRGEAQAVLARIAEAEGVADQPQAVLADTSPARALQRLAQRDGAELIVLGSSHRGPVGRALLGDVSRAVLHGAPCPVAIAPSGYASAPVATIGVAHDGSAEADVALTVAVLLARRHGARLRVLRVVDTTVPGMGLYPIALDWEHLLADQRDDDQRALDELVAHLDDIAVEARAEIGTPRELLAALGAEVDLLASGSRGWGPIGRVVVGSTSRFLIQHAACPVVVVPRGATAAGDDDV